MPLDPLPARPKPRPIARPAHTAAVIAVILGTAAVGAFLQRRAPAGPGIVGEHQGAVGIYVTAMALDWALFYFAWVGTHRFGGSLFDVSGLRWPGARRFAIDAAVAVPFWVVWELTARGVHRLLGPSSAKTVDVLLPRTALEIGVWVLVSVTAGFCEEAVFRGYLQTQLRAWTGSAPIAVILQAVLFGIAHGYQGWKNVVVIFALGVLYGVLFVWRGNVRSGALAHAWSDVYGGLRLRFPF